MRLLMIHEAYKPVYMWSKFFLRTNGRTNGRTNEGIPWGPRGPKNGYFTVSFLWTLFWRVFFYLRLWFHVFWNGFSRPRSDHCLSLSVNDSPTPIFRLDWCDSVCKRCQLLDDVIKIKVATSNTTKMLQATDSWSKLAELPRSSRSVPDLPMLP